MVLLVALLCLMTCISFWCLLILHHLSVAYALWNIGVLPWWGNLPLSKFFALSYFCLLNKCAFSLDLLSLHNKKNSPIVCHLCLYCCRKVWVLLKTFLQKPKVWLNWKSFNYWNCSVVFEGELLWNWIRFMFCLFLFWNVLFLVFILIVTIQPVNLLILAFCWQWHSEWFFQTNSCRHGSSEIN